MSVEDRLEVLELDVIYLENEVRALKERIRLATREPLSDDEIDKVYQESCKNYYDLAFRDGVRFAEKYHKISINNV